MKSSTVTLLILNAAVAVSAKVSYAGAKAMRVGRATLNSQLETVFTYNLFSCW